MKYHLTTKSSNAKTGPIPVSTTSAATCPNVCPFKKSGCYADGGPLALHWAAVTRGERGTDLATFCKAIANLPAGTLWRHNQAGDLPGMGNTIDAGHLAAIVKANEGKRGFTYTHKPMGVAANRHAVARSNAAGFTINLSANNLAHADTLCDLNMAPVVVVLPSDQTENTTTPRGRNVVVCPATQHEDVTCATCQMCQRSSLNRPVIGFPAHGASHRKATVIALRRI